MPDETMEFPLALKGRRVGHDTWEFALMLGDERITRPILQEVNVGDWIPARAAEALKRLLRTVVT